MDISDLDSEHADYEWAIVLSRTCMRILGIWPEIHKTVWKRFVINIRIIVSINIVIWSIIVPALHSLIRIWGDIMCMIDNLQYSLPIVISIIKVILIWRQKHVLISLLEMIKTDWMKLKTEEERAVMIKQARIARAIVIFGCLMMVCSANLVIILPTFGISIRYLTNITDPGRLLPLQTYYLYDVNNSPLYEVTFILQCLSLVIVCIIYTSTDTFMSFLVFHVCGQLENLKMRIRNLDKFNNFSDAFAFNVRDHIRLIRSIKVIDNIFNIILLILLIYFGMLFAMYGFLLVTVITQGRDLSIPRLIYTIAALFNSFAHICLHCVIGEILVMQCEGIYQAACQYKWYKLKPKQAKHFINIIMETSRPLYLTAGNVFPLTIATLCNLLKTSAGYISVLLAHRT